MTVAEQTESFLQAMFSPADVGSLVEVRSVPGNSKFVDVRSEAYPQLEDLLHGDWYFGVATRNQRREIVGGTVVWCDVDSKAPAALAESGKIIPEPSATVSSGHGTHLYWVLDRTVEVDLAVRLSRLSALAFQGDYKVCEPRRVMRLPGSFNHKHKEAPQAVLVQESTAKYDPQTLEEALVAVALSRIWNAGESRNSLLLGLAAVLARAEWPENRVRNAVKLICELSHDEEVSNRQLSATITLQKHGAGQSITALPLKEALGDDYQHLLDGLGITARNGDMLVDGSVVGNTSTLERDLVSYLDSDPNWSFSDGAIVRWSGDRWAYSNPDELQAYCFDRIARIRVVMNGDEQDFAITSRLAGAIAKIVQGHLSTRSLAEMPANYLPLKNGVLDLASENLLPHAPENRNRWVVDVEYDGGRGAPLWAALLQEATPQAVGFIQEFAGYCLQQGNPFERMLWLYGPSGTGKSTVVKTLLRLFGEAGVAVNIDRITEYTVASMANARVAVCTEMSPQMLRTISLKALVSGDPVQGRHPYGRPFDVCYRGKFICASNSLPPVDEGEGLWRRLALIPFHVKPSAPDPLLSQKLEAELPGILNWAVAGLRRLQGYGGSWPLPDISSSLVEEYKISSQVFKTFFEEEMVVDSESEISVKEVYGAYFFWANERGLKVTGPGPAFWQEMRGAGMEPMPPRRVGGRLVRLWRGARLVGSTFSA